MNSYKIFFFSLLILSFVMGIDWYKHKPKYVPPISNTKEAIKFKEIQLDESEKKDTEENEENDEEEKNDKEDKENNKESDIEESQKQKSENISENNLKEESDPLIVYFKQLERNPFEESPYVKLIEQIRKKEEERIAIQNKAVEKITLPVQLNAQYLGSIKLGSELKAMINSKTYAVGDDFENKTIKEITPELVVLKDASGKFLIPKKGVQLNIAQDGTYTTDDTYFKKAF